MGVFWDPAPIKFSLGPRGWKVLKPILDACDVRSDMLKDVAPWKADSRPLDVVGIVSWLDSQGFNTVTRAA